MEFLRAAIPPSLNDPARALVAVPGFRRAGLSAVCVLACILFLFPLATQARAATQSFVYTGGEETFTVPTGVFSVHVIAVGGRGGNAPSAPGGAAAEVGGELAVTPGETLYVEVGGNGGQDVLGGFNGGGDAGGTGAGGGGGATDVRTAPLSRGLTPDDRLLVAGGGGGGGASNDGPCISGAGGAAGGEGEATSCAVSGGGPGTQTSGGGGGWLGGQGQLGSGGEGGPIAYALGRGGGGGGGGGGYYGGGGGSGDADNGGAGGGGGSSLVPAGGSLALAPAAIQPQVQVTYLGPVAVTGVASGLTRSSATLSATVNPEGEKVASCHFEYGISLSLGSSAPCAALPGAGTSPVAVFANVKHLLLNATYYFRVVAGSATGTSDGIEQAFTTLPNPPKVITGAPVAVAQNSATLNGTVNPEGGTVTNCHFEYGPSRSYGLVAPCASSPGSGSTPVAVNAWIDNLSPNATYYDRITATTRGGSQYGRRGRFSTKVGAETFTYTGSEQTFIVPASVFSLHVVAVGGHGGATASAGGLAGGVGGAAAQVAADISVTPGETLYVEVGGNGGLGGPESGGGFNGGGDGAGGGGGATDVRTAPLAAGLTPDDRLLVAGGGGGGGGVGPDDTDGEAGGDAGQPGAGECPGGAGTESSGGAGSCESIPGGEGAAGELGIGGNGGGFDHWGTPSGGGGGGYYGGGGGGSYENGQSGSGGGGGSSLVPAGGSIELAGADAQPEVQISYS